LSSASLLIALSVAAMMFSIGVAGVLVKRNPIMIFMSIELMLNAVNVASVAFGRYLGHAGGQMLTIFVMAVAAAEVAVGLGILMVVFRNRERIDVDDVKALGG
jgi:NADH-quinone oxidoreductase subunit K